MSTADHGKLRAFLLNRKTWRAAAVLAAALLGIFMYQGMKHGAAADACAEKIESAIAAKDQAYITKAVRNPSLRETLLSAKKAELTFVRPISSSWTRIGLAVTPQNQPKAQLRVLLLDQEKAPECVFLKDYEASKPSLPAASPSTP